MLIFDILITILCVAILTGLIKLIKSQPKISKSLAIKRCMKKGYAVISLANNGKMFNFLLDSASNVSHFCSEYAGELKGATIDTIDDEITGFGGTVTQRTEYCIANFNDIAHNKYRIIMSLSDTLSKALKGFEKDAKITIHGLLGTPFLKGCGCNIDYSTLKIFPKK